MKTSGKPDAFDRLRVRPTLVEHVLRNTVLDEVPTRPAAQVYAGALYAGFDFEGLNAQGRERADANVVITSALWGLLRPSDPIPAYRLHICARLSGMGGLERTGRPLIAGLLASAARPAGVALDLRSPAYQAMGKPTAGSPTGRLRSASCQRPARARSAMRLPSGVAAKLPTFSLELGVAHGRPTT